MMINMLIITCSEVLKRLTVVIGVVVAINVKHKKMVLYCK